MGKIVALGGGRFDNGEMDNVTEHIISLTGKKNPLILIIPTASYDNMTDDDDVKLCFEKFGCTTDILFLTHEDVTESVIAEKINACDGIFVQGGNLLFLMETWKKTGADKYLLKAFEEDKVLSGTSSGAMCWFTEGYDDCLENNAFAFVECLDIIKGYINCPHYQSEYWQSFEKALPARTLSGIACDNGAGFCFVDGKFYTVCGNEDGDCFLYDKNCNYKKINLTEHPEVLEIL